MSTHWASGGPRSRVRAPRSVPAAKPAPAHAPEGSLPAAQAPEPDRSPPAAHLPPAGRVGAIGAISAEWAPTAGRVMLGVVLFWFGYHELVQPGGWTQYVPVVNESSSLAVILVLAHGWVLFVLAAALVAGIAPRVAAAIASVVLLEIVISLAVTGLSATALRDLGVLGLAVCLTGVQNQRLVLRG
jgi:uncharacterized membrane protein YphA (DoxX/SURF4 family)